MTNPFSAIATELGRTVAEAKPLLARLNNADTSQPPAPSKWSRKEILGHLLDSASNNHQRFVRAALEGSLVFPGYDQEGLVKLQRFSEVDWGFLVDVWASYNRLLAHVISSLPSSAAAISCKIGRHDPATLAWIAEDYVEHLKHHLNQIVGSKFHSNYNPNA